MSHPSRWGSRGDHSQRCSQPTVSSHTGHNLSRLTCSAQTRIGGDPFPIPADCTVICVEWCSLRPCVRGRPSPSVIAVTDPHHVDGVTHRECSHSAVLLCQWSFGALQCSLDVRRKSTSRNRGIRRSLDSSSCSYNSDLPHHLANRVAVRVRNFRSTGAGRSAP